MPLRRMRDDPRTFPVLSSRGAQKGYRIIDSRVLRLTWLHLSSPALSLPGRPVASSEPPCRATCRKRTVLYRRPGWGGDGLRTG
jgi:hypothetical protein